MGTLEDAVNTLRAALSPTADPAAKAQAASILRTLLAALEPPGTASGTQAGDPPDVLGALVEKLRPYLPPEGVQPVGPRLAIPLVPIPKR